MKPFTCPEVDHHLWRYIDRELPASDLASISAHLRDCDDCRARYLDRAREASQYRQVFVGSPFGERFVAGFRKRMREEGLHKLAGQPGWRGVSFHRRRLFRIATVAAMVILIPVVVLVGFLSRDRAGLPLGGFKTSGGRATVYRAGSTAAEQAESETLVEGSFGAGDRIVLGAGVLADFSLASTSWRGESQLTLTGPAQLLFERGASRSEFLARLTKGKLLAEVEERGPSERFEISTPHALARVIGTVFELTVTQEETRLEVSRGKVRFEAADALPTDNVHVTPEMGVHVVRAGETRPEAVVEVDLGATAESLSSTPAANGEPARADEIAGEKTQRPSGSGVIPTHVEPQPSASAAPAVPPPAAGEKPAKPATPIPDLDTPVNAPRERE
jgi:hypothetical protein